MGKVFETKEAFRDYLCFDSGTMPSAWNRWEELNASISRSTCDCAGLLTAALCHMMMTHCALFLPTAQVSDMPLEPRATFDEGSSEMLVPFGVAVGGGDS